MHDAGLTGFIPQYAVEDEYGWPRYRLDLADPKRKVAAEYDGSSHLGRPSLRRDRDRHNWLDERGWRMRYFTDANLYRGPQGIIRSLQAALKGR